jgi:IclR family KDG regulon transcriptional repressor
VAEAKPKVETRSLDRGLMVLSSLAQAADGLTAPELAEMNELSRATVYRLLSTLTARHFVIHDKERRRYRLGPAVEAWAAGVESSTALSALARPVIERVAADIKETVGLFVRIGYYRVCVFRVESPHLLRHVRKLGERRPLAVGASGTVLMCQLSDEELVTVCDHYADLLKADGLTVDDVRKRIAGTRRKGHFAVSNDTIPGLAAVATPVIGPAGRITAALAATGPVERFTSTVQREAVKQLKRAGTEIAQASYFTA